jgi:hypothetical protein
MSGAFCVQGPGRARSRDPNFSMPANDPPSNEIIAAGGDSDDAA